MWVELGHEPSVATAGFRVADPALLVAESVIAIGQVDGKVRDRFEVSPNITEDELRSIVLASAQVIKAIGDHEVASVVVRAPKLVNIVTK